MLVTCAHCKEVIPARTDVAAHLRSHSAVCATRCPLCPCVAAVLDLYSKHRAEDHKEGDDCPVEDALDAIIAVRNGRCAPAKVAHCGQTSHATRHLRDRVVKVWTREVAAPCPPCEFRSAGQEEHSEHWKEDHRNRRVLNVDCSIL